MEYMQDSNTLKLKRKNNLLENVPYNIHKRCKESRPNIAEYGSDSSAEDSSDEENSGMEMDVKANEKNGKEDEDMFLSDNYNQIENHEKPKKPKIQLLDVAKFKKENLAELNSSIENGEVQGEEEDVNIEPFNIDNEMEHGVFDKDGNYIEKEGNGDDELRDDEEWMNNVIDTKKINQIEKKEDTKAQNSRFYMVHEALVLLKFFLIDDVNTVLQSLGRLNKLRKMAISENSKSLKYIIYGIELLSDLINILESKGFNGIYEYNRKKVQEAIEEERLDDSSKVDDRKTKLWSFKWLSKLDQIHGRYTNYEMSYWQKTYFQNNVIVKFHSEPDQDENWIHISCLNFT